MATSDDILLEHKEKKHILKQKCSLCNFATPFEVEFHEHVSRDHPTSQKCTMCNFVGADSDARNLHEDQKHMFNLKCQMCDYTSPQNSATLLQHIQNVHPGCKKCDRCNFLAANEEIYQVHQTEKHTDLKNCSICKCLPASEEHLQEYHPNCKKCIFCNFICFDATEFEAHEEDEHFMKKKCRYCHYTTAYDVRMDAHMDVEHPGKMVRQNRTDVGNFMDMNVDGLESTLKVNTLNSLTLNQTYLCYFIVKLRNFKT
jgi:hypothetical protein